jgi:hypothetical protein
MGGSVGTRADLDAVERSRESNCDRPDSSLSLYRLSYLGSCVLEVRVSNLGLETEFFFREIPQPHHVNVRIVS